MARPIVLSNGELHVGLNNFGLVHDFYYPYVGLENHSSGAQTRHRVGVWVDGELSWLDDEGAWAFSFRYPHQALIGRTVARSDRLGILIEIDDFVDASMSAFIRNIHVVNLRGTAREIRLFTHQAFIMSDSRGNTDTAQYLPDSEAILHYRGRRAFVVAGTHQGRPFDQHSIGLFGIEGREGTYRDADDGQLDSASVEHGRVDSTLRFTLKLTAHDSGRVHYWIAAGTSTRDALYIDKQIRQRGAIAMLHQTAEWWREWLGPARVVSDKLGEDYRESFLHSLMIVKAHIDKHGAVIASTDTSLLKYSRDAYAYCWPRDAAYALWPLIRMGYTEEPHRFFEFCRRGLHSGGYLMQKYWADGGLGASWHSYVHEEGVSPPIQQDETAIVLFVFAQFYETNNDPKILRDFYDTLVRPMAHFLAEYIDETTGLPRPSYDLWEEVHLTTTYTTSVVYAALLAAADLAEQASDPDNAVHWRSAADDIAQAAHKYLYNSERKSFYKGVRVKNGKIFYDDTIDSSSIYGAFMFGLFPAGSPELTNALNSFEEAFSNPNGKIGLPRYENDHYRRADTTGPGNWWFITTLWYAQYCLESGRGDEAIKVLDWVRQLSTSTGAIAEQIDPTNNATIAPVPLVWSQAEYLSTLLDTITEKKP